MDEIELKVGMQLDAFDEPVDEVDIFINGEDLRDLAREVELPFATGEGNSLRAGSYAGLPPEAVFLPSKRLLGEPSKIYDDYEEKISLLGCGVVVWRYEGFGPFVFERRQYLAELGKFGAFPTSSGEPRI